MICIGYFNLILSRNFIIIDLKFQISIDFDYENFDRLIDLSIIGTSLKKEQFKGEVKF